MFISNENYKRLIKAEKLLLALQECGVDNWEGYSDAHKIAFPEDDDEDEDEDC